MTLKIWTDKTARYVPGGFRHSSSWGWGLLNTFRSMAANPSLEAERQSEIQELHCMEMRTDVDEGMRRFVPMFEEDG